MDKKEKTVNESIVFQSAMTAGLVNGLLVLFKLAAGIFGLSLAMIADAVHSFSDYLSDILVVYHLRMERKPSNDEHDYGHGRVAVLAAGVVGIVLIVIGILICYLCTDRLVDYFSDYSIPRPGIIALTAALVSILVKVILWQYMSRRDKVSDNEILKVRAWQYRNDAITSVGTSIGIAVAMFFGSKWRLLDSVTAIIVCFFVFKIGWTYIKEAYYQLTDKSLPLEVEARIKEIACSEENVIDVYEVLTRRIGGNAAVELRIGMSGEAPLHDAYEHVLNIEKKLHAELGDGAHIGIRIEPAKPSNQG